MREGPVPRMYARRAAAGSDARAARRPRMTSGVLEATTVAIPPPSAANHIELCPVCRRMFRQSILDRILAQGEHRLAASTPPAVEESSWFDRLWGWLQHTRPWQTMFRVPRQGPENG